MDILVRGRWWCGNMSISCLLLALPLMLVWDSSYRNTVASENFGSSVDLHCSEVSMKLWLVQGYSSCLCKKGLVINLAKTVLCRMWKTAEILLCKGILLNLMQQAESLKYFRSWFRRDIKSLPWGSRVICGKHGAKGRAQKLSTN